MTFLSKNSWLTWSINVRMKFNLSPANKTPIELLPTQLFHKLNSSTWKDLFIRRSWWWCDCLIFLISMWLASNDVMLYILIPWFWVGLSLTFHGQMQIQLEKVACCRCHCHCHSMPLNIFISFNIQTAHCFFQIPNTKLIEATYFRVWFQGDTLDYLSRPNAVSDYEYYCHGALLSLFLLLFLL